eukprot:3642068-Pyramimonas_sp.AAC.1
MYRYVDCAGNSGADILTAGSGRRAIQRSRQSIANIDGWRERRRLNKKCANVAEKCANVAAGVSSWNWRRAGVQATTPRYRVRPVLNEQTTT